MPANLSERSGITWRFHQHFAHAQCTSIHGARQLQRRRACGLELLGEDSEKVALNGDFSCPRLRLAGVKNEFSQKRTDVDDAAVPGKFADEPRCEIQGPHRYRTGHGDAVSGPGWNPYGSARRNDPDSLFRPNCHHTPGGKHNLIGVVKVFGHTIAVAVFVTKCRQLGGRTAPCIEPDMLTHFRNGLSQ